MAHPQVNVPRSGGNSGWTSGAEIPVTQMATAILNDRTVG